MRQLSIAILLFVVQIKLNLRNMDVSEDLNGLEMIRVSVHENLGCLVCLLHQDFEIVLSHQADLD